MVIDGSSIREGTMKSVVAKAITLMNENSYILLICPSNRNHISQEEVHELSPQAKLINHPENPENEIELLLYKI